MASLTDTHTMASSSTSVFDSIAETVSSFFPTVHADEGEDEAEGDEGSEEGGEEEGGEEEEEEEEDEPEDPMPGIQEGEREVMDMCATNICMEDCENSRECSSAKHHFLECQERVEAGNGFKDENCVEEL